MALPSLSTTPSCELATIEKLRESMMQQNDYPVIKLIRQLNADRLNEIVNEKYIVNHDEETTLLIEATRYKNLNIIECLLKYCNINVNATGNIKYNYISFHHTNGVTALWLAASLGSLSIVEFLIDNGANVNCCTEEKSTPLQAACYCIQVDIVKYLIKHGANVDITCNDNYSCLMTACDLGHEEIVKHLLVNGADIDKQTILHGYSAMHYAARRNDLKIVVILVAFNAQHLKDNQSITPTLIAAEKCYYALVNYLLEAIYLTRKEIIDVKELLGASLLVNNEFNDNHKNLGFSYLLDSMTLRYNFYPVLLKEVYKKIEAYSNRVECQSVEDIMNIKNNNEALHFESLIIRERILGDTNENILPSIIYHGLKYAESQNYIQCLKLWNHALKIAQKNGTAHYENILIDFIEVFNQMMENKVNIELTELQSVLKVVIEQLKTIQNNILASNSRKNKMTMERRLTENLFLTTDLIIIISTVVLPQCRNSEDPLFKDILQLVVKLNKLDLRLKGGQTLLHTCIMIRKGSFSYNCISIKGVYCLSYPNFSAMKLLIFCGADVNAYDLNNDTLLHYIGEFVRSTFNSAIQHDADNSITKKFVMELLNNGAHTDYTNNDGECPHTGYLKTLFHLTNNTPLSLKCLSAKVVNHQFSKEWYQNQLPVTLHEFTNLH